MTDEANRVELVDARCDVEAVERLRQSYEGQVDGMTLIARTECPRCGRVFTEGDGNVCRGPWALNQHEPAEWVRVEYVPAEQLRGAVEALREIKRVAAIEAPPVSDEVPAKVWKLAFDALNAIGGSSS